MQVNGEAQNLTPPPPRSNPGRGNHKNWVWVLGVSFPRMRDFARQIPHQ